MDEDLAWVRPPDSPGRIGMLPLPGLVILRRGERGIDCEARERVLDRLAAERVSLLVCLLGAEDCDPQDIAELEAAAAVREIALRRFPIGDFEAPGSDESWPVLAAAITEALGRRRAVAFCCLAGYGRSGMMAARVLIDAGMEPRTAIETVRAARPGAIESDVQIAYLLAASP